MRIRRSAYSRKRCMTLLIFDNLNFNEHNFLTGGTNIETLRGLISCLTSTSLEGGSSFAEAT